MDLEVANLALTTDREMTDPGTSSLSGAAKDAYERELASSLLPSRQAGLQQEVLSAGVSNEEISLFYQDFC